MSEQSKSSSSELFLGTVVIVSVLFEFGASPSLTLETFLWLVCREEVLHPPTSGLLGAAPVQHMVACFFYALSRLQDRLRCFGGMWNLSVTPFPLFVCCPFSCHLVFAPPPPGDRRKQAMAGDAQKNTDADGGETSKAPSQEL